VEIPELYLNLNIDDPVMRDNFNEIMKYINKLREMVDENTQEIETNHP